MLQTAVRSSGKKAAAAAGAVVVGAASSSSAESRSAAPLLADDGESVLLRQSAELIKEQMKEQGLLVSTRSDDGSEWLDVPSVGGIELSDLVDLGASVAANPAVQRVVAEQLRAFDWSARGLEVSTTLEVEEEELSEKSSDDFSLVSHPLVAENEALRAENDRLREALAAGPVEEAAVEEAAPVVGDGATTNERPAVARMQALVRGVLTRDGYYREVFLPQPRVSVRIKPVAGGDGRACVQLTLVPEFLGAGAARRKTRAQKERPRKALVVTTAIVVGVRLPLSIAMPRSVAMPPSIDMPSIAMPSPLRQPLVDALAALCLDCQPAWPRTGARPRHRPEPRRRSRRRRRRRLDGRTAAHAKGWALLGLSPVGGAAGLEWQWVCGGGSRNAGVMGERARCGRGKMVIGRWGFPWRQHVCVGMLGWHTLRTSRKT